MFNRLFHRSAKPQCTKMAAAAGAVGLFVKSLHRRCDAGALFSFGNTLKQETGFTHDESTLHAGLAGLDAGFRQAAKANQGEGTRLFDSVVDGLTIIDRAAAPGVPRVVVVVTDGRDNGSNRYRNDPRGAGRAVAQLIACAEGPCLPFVIAVGSDAQVDTDGLAQFGESGGFPVASVDSMPRLGGLLAVLATEITARVTRRELRTGGLVISHTTPELLVRRTPMAYAVLLDRSGSMTEPA